MYYIDNWDTTFHFIGISDNNKDMLSISVYSHEQCIRSNHKKGGGTSQIQYKTRDDLAFPPKIYKSIFIEMDKNHKKYAFIMGEYNVITLIEPHRCTTQMQEFSYIFLLFATIILYFIILHNQVTILYSRYERIKYDLNILSTPNNEFTTIKHITM